MSQSPFPSQLDQKDYALEEEESLGGQRSGDVSRSAIDSKTSCENAKVVEPSIRGLLERFRYDSPADRESRRQVQDPLWWSQPSDARSTPPTTTTLPAETVAGTLATTKTPPLEEAEPLAMLADVDEVALLKEGSTKISPAPLSKNETFQGLVLEEVVDNAQLGNAQTGEHGIPAKTSNEIDSTVQKVVTAEPQPVQQLVAPVDQLETSANESLLIKPPLVELKETVDLNPIANVIESKSQSVQTETPVKAKMEVLQPPSNVSVEVDVPNKSPVCSKSSVSVVTAASAIEEGHETRPVDTIELDKTSSGVPVSQRYRVRILWDIENLTVPKTVSAFTLCVRLCDAVTEEALHAWNLSSSEHIATRIFCYHNPSNNRGLTRKVRKQLSVACCTLVDVGKDKEGAADNAIFVEMEHIIQEFDPLYTVVALISGDMDFVAKVKQLTEANFKTVCIYPFGKGNLRHQSYQQFSWKSLDWTKLLSHTINFPQLEDKSHTLLSVDTLLNEAIEDPTGDTVHLLQQCSELQEKVQEELALLQKRQLAVAHEIRLEEANRNDSTNLDFVVAQAMRDARSLQ